MKLYDFCFRLFCSLSVIKQSMCEEIRSKREHGEIPKAWSCSFNALVFLLSVVSAFLIAIT